MIIFLFSQQFNVMLSENIYYQYQKDRKLIIIIMIWKIT